MTRPDAYRPAHASQRRLPQNGAEGPDLPTTAETSAPLDPAAEAARPPRPQMERTPAPASPALVRPPAVHAALGLSYGGLGAGAVGVASALLWRAGGRENLLAMMVRSTVDEARKQQLADLLLYGTIGVVVVLLFVQLALVVRLSSARAGARTGLALVVVAQVLLYFFASGIVQDTGWKGVVVQVALGVQAATAVLASLLSWLPSVGRWLGRRSAARRR